jgi:Fe-S oxidoreductase
MNASMMLLFDIFVSITRFIHTPESEKSNAMRKYIANLSAGMMMLIALTSFTSDQEIVYQEMEGVRITYTKQQKAINDNEVMEYLILKIENTNNYGVKMNWKLDIWYNGACRTCDKPSPSGYEFSLNLKAKEKVEGDINKEDLMLKIYFRTVKPEREGGLTRFEFTNLNISKN